jgi:hypothetical protein
VAMIAFVCLGIWMLCRTNRAVLDQWFHDPYIRGNRNLPWHWGGRTGTHNCSNAPDMSFCKTGRAYRRITPHSHDRVRSAWLLCHSLQIWTRSVS